MGTDLETSYNRETLLEMFHSRVVEVKFRKENGDIRVLRGTLKEDLIPQTAFNHEREERSVNPNVMTVWDLEVGDWRSFRIGSLIAVL